MYRSTNMEQNDDWWLRADGCRSSSTRDHLSAQNDVLLLRADGQQHRKHESSDDVVPTRNDGQRLPADGHWRADLKEWRRHLRRMET